MKTAHVQTGCTGKTLAGVLNPVPRSRDRAETHPTSYRIPVQCLLNLMIQRLDTADYRPNPPASAAATSPVYSRPTTAKVGERLWQPRGSNRAATHPPGTSTGSSSGRPAAASRPTLRTETPAGHRRAARSRPRPGKPPPPPRAHLPRSGRSRRAPPQRRARRRAAAGPARRTSPARGSAPPGPGGRGPAPRRAPAAAAARPPAAPRTGARRPAGTPPWPRAGRGASGRRSPARALPVGEAGGAMEERDGRADGFRKVRRARSGAQPRAVPGPLTRSPLSAGDGGPAAPPPLPGREDPRYRGGGGPGRGGRPPSLSALSLQLTATRSC